MGYLASPRRRRRLAWIAAILAVAGIVTVAASLLPSRGGRGGGTPAPPNPSGVTRPTGPVFGAPPDAATERARRRAEAVVRPLAAAFLSDLQARRNLRRAHALLAPSLRSRYGLADWRAGRHLPLSVDRGATPSGATVAFSGRTLVGIVAAYDTAAQAESALYALRFRKLEGRWLIDYLHQGHSSRYVDASTYAPGGFIPGTASNGTRSWLLLALGLVAVIAVVALIDRRLSRRPRGADA